jgi:DNA-binding response OmpR family regulator
MDRRAIVVSYNGQEINLGKKEFLMLELLLLNIGDTLAYEDFLSYLYRSPDEEPCPRTIDSFIFLIRRKLRYAGAPREFIESGHPQGSPGTYFLREEECAVAA